jgi:hypothetical protein
MQLLFEFNQNLPTSWAGNVASNQFLFLDCCRHLVSKPEFRIVCKRPLNNYSRKTFINLRARLKRCWLKHFYVLLNNFIHFCKSSHNDQSLNTSRMSNMIINGTSCAPKILCPKCSSASSNENDIWIVFPNYVNLFARTCSITRDVRNVFLFLSGDFKFSLKVFISCPRNTPRG